MHATAPIIQNPSLLDALLTNKLDCERDLVKFNTPTARFAICSNNKCTAKGVPDEMNMYKTFFCNVDKLTIKLSKVLDKREKAWLENKTNSVNRVCRKVVMLL